MTLNALGYCLYLLFTCTVIVHVGWQCYQHGKHYLIDVFRGNKDLAINTNKLLLVGYYLLNIGYVLVTINSWEEIYTITQLLGNLTNKLGFIILGLGIIHFFNIWGTRILDKYINPS